MEKSKNPIRECLLYEYHLGINAVIETNIGVNKDLIKKTSIFLFYQKYF